MMQIVHYNCTHVAVILKLVRGSLVCIENINNFNWIPVHK